MQKSKMKALRHQAVSGLLGQIWSAALGDYTQSAALCGHKFRCRGTRLGILGFHLWAGQKQYPKALFTEFYVPPQSGLGVIWFWPESGG